MTDVRALNNAQYEQYVERNNFRQKVGAAAGLLVLIAIITVMALLP